MLSPKILLSAALLILLCACGPPTSTDPAAKESEFVLYEPSEEELTKTREDVGLKMVTLKARLNDLVTDYNYDSVASGTTEKTEQRAGGTERMDNLPDRGANVGQTFDSLTAYNRDLLGGAAKMEADSEDLTLEANAKINAAKAALATARAKNKWTDEEVKTREAPILAAEQALQDLDDSRKAMKSIYNSGENYIEQKRAETDGDPTKL